MTEDMPATPGWVDTRLDEAFATLPSSPEVASARRAYAECLAARKQPGTPSDTLGAEFEPCDAALRRALQAAGIEAPARDRLLTALEAIEAEIAGES